MVQKQFRGEGLSLKPQAGCRFVGAGGECGSASLSWNLWAEEGKKGADSGHSDGEEARTCDEE